MKGKKGKIEKSGCLQIERAGKLKDQDCPFNSEAVRCGDHCPLFGEPEQYLDGTNGREHTGWSLKICQDRELRFETFTDERGKE